MCHLFKISWELKKSNADVAAMIKFIYLFNWDNAH